MYVVEGKEEERCMMGLHQFGRVDTVFLTLAFRARLSGKFMNFFLICFPPLSFAGIYNQTKWVSAPRRSESRESTEPDMVPLSVKSCERWKSLSTPPTVASSAERTLSSDPALESGTAGRARRLLLEVPTFCLQLVVSLFAVQLDV